MDSTLNELLGYLDSVETEMTKDIVIPDMSQAEELRVEVTNRIGDLESTVAATRDRELAADTELKTCKDESRRIIEKLRKKRNETKAKLAKKIASQKAKYEDVVQRHQQLVDGLLKEKEALALECAGMNKRAQATRQGAAQREKNIQEQAAHQIAQQRELAIAQEKARQKKLLEDKVREVKETTVRGLEPEIQNLMARQRREIDSIRAEQEEELATARAAIERGAEEERQRLTEQMVRERDTEFRCIEQRMKRQTEREREAHVEEIERVKRKLRELENVKIEVKEVAKSENEMIIAEARERYKAELDAEKLRSRKEIEQAEARVKEALDTVKQDMLNGFRPKEDEMRREIEAENKDRAEKKLRVVIQKLEAHMDHQKKLAVDGAERKLTLVHNEINRTNELIKKEEEQHEREMEGLRKEFADEKSLNNKLEMENDRLTQEADHHRSLRSNLQTELSEKETELSQIRIEMAKRELSAREMVLDDIKEIRKQLEESRIEMREENARFQAEKREIENQHAAELASVSAKVKTLIESKEAVARTLKEQLAAAQARLTEMEGIFQRQKAAVRTKKK